MTLVTQPFPARNPFSLAEQCLRGCGEVSANRRRGVALGRGPACHENDSQDVGDVSAHDIFSSNSDGENLHACSVGLRDMETFRNKTAFSFYADVRDIKVELQEEIHRL